MNNIEENMLNKILNKYYSGARLMDIISNALNK